MGQSGELRGYAGSKYEGAGGHGITPLEPTYHFKADTGPCCQFIELDLVFPSTEDTTRRAPRPAAQRYFGIATEFFDLCFERDVAKSELRTLYS